MRVPFVCFPNINPRTLNEASYQLRIHNTRIKAENSCIALYFQLADFLHSAMRLLANKIAELSSRSQLSGQSLIAIMADELAIFQLHRRTLIQQSHCESRAGFSGENSIWIFLHVALIQVSPCEKELRARVYVRLYACDSGHLRSICGRRVEITSSTCSRRNDNKSLLLYRDLIPQVRNSVCVLNKKRSQLLIIRGILKFLQAYICVRFRGLLLKFRLIFLHQYCRSKVRACST